MEDTELVKEFCTACENGDTERLERILADGYRFHHRADDRRAGKREFIQMITRLKRAVPDLRFDVREIRPGEPVRGKVRLSGSHKNTLDLSTIGGPRVESTGRRFELPEEPGEWRIKNGLIQEHKVENVPGGGLAGILDQLGAKVPAQRP